MRSSILRREPLPIYLSQRRSMWLCRARTFTTHEPEPLHLEALSGAQTTVARLVPLAAPEQPKDKRRKTESTREGCVHVALRLHGHRRSASADTRQRGERWLMKKKGHAYEHHDDGKAVRDGGMMTWVMMIARFCWGARIPQAVSHVLGRGDICVTLPRKRRSPETERGCSASDLQHAS